MLNLLVVPLAWKLMITKKKKKRTSLVRQNTSESIYYPKKMAQTQKMKNRTKHPIMAPQKTSTKLPKMVLRKKRKRRRVRKTKSTRKIKRARKKRLIRRKRRKRKKRRRKSDFR